MALTLEKIAEKVQLEKLDRKTETDKNEIKEQIRINLNW